MPGVCVVCECVTVHLRLHNRVSVDDTNTVTRSKHPTPTDAGLYHLSFNEQRHVVRVHVPWLLARLSAVCGIPQSH